MGDSTILDTLQFNVQSPVTKARFTFQASAPIAAGLPPLPSSVAWPANVLLAEFPTDTAYKYHRDVLGVEFDSAASLQQFENIITQYNASLIGGIGIGTPLKLYVLQFPDPGPDYASLDSLVNQLSAEPGVVLVTALAFAPGLRLRGRYPIDAGLAPNRLDWHTGTPQTSAFNAVRAPLAWGCENGAYGASLPSVGIVDAFFDVIPSDLVATNRFFPQPSEQVLDPGFAQLAANHGVAVAGIIGARGDNGAQMAGMMWGLPMTMYAIGQGQNRARNDVSYVADVFSHAAANQLRVINISAGVGNIQYPQHVSLLKAWLRHYLDSGDQRLVIISSGDNGIALTLTQLAASTDSRLTALDRAAAQLLLEPSNNYQGKLLFVTGTDQSGQHTPLSNVWTGNDSAIVAAPAVAVYSLTDAGQVVPWQHTSFSAPFVTGLAAQLWTMDPTLSALEVVHYIYWGAREPRRAPTSGILTPPSDIGVSGIYQLDAYGALSLLSKERPGTPICGFPVKLEFPSTGPRVVLTRNGQNVEQVPLPGPSLTNTHALSVAQGGRLFAVNAEDPTTGDLNVLEYLLANGQWSVRRTIPGLLSRTYLEKDTVDLDQQFTNHVLRGSQWGASGTVLCSVPRFVRHSGAS